MKAINFKEQNIVFAEEQEEYINLPAHMQKGISTFCMELDEDELKRIKKSRYSKIGTLTFDDPAQPMRIRIQKPKLPINKRTSFMCDPEWQGNTAIFWQRLDSSQINRLVKEKRIWVSVITFDKPLHPIMMNVL